MSDPFTANMTSKPWEFGHEPTGMQCKLCKIFSTGLFPLHLPHKSQRANAHCSCAQCNRPEIVELSSQNFCLQLELVQTNYSTGPCAWDDASTACTTPRSCRLAVLVALTSRMYYVGYGIITEQSVPRIGGQVTQNRAYTGRIVTR